MRIIYWIQVTFSTLCLLAIVLTILINIFFRAVLNRPFLWSIELSSILIIWSVYMALGINYRENNHFGIDLLKDRLSEKHLKALDVFKDAVILITAGFSVYFSFFAIRTNFYVKTMALNVSVSLAYYLAFLIGSFSILFYIVLKYFEKYKKVGAK